MNGKQLKNSILQWAIQGKLVPQDPNDEPASVLLEKIRQEKERLIKEKKIKRDKNASIIFRGEDNSYYEKVLATGEVKCIDEEIPFEVPQGWEWVRLKNVALSIARGKSPVYSTNSNYLAFAQKCNTKKGNIDLSLALHFDNTKAKRYDPVLYLQKEDIVINSTGNGTLGRVGFFDCEYPQGIIGIIPDSHVTPIHVIKVNSKYIYHCLKYHQPYLESKGEGGTNQKELKPTIIAELLLPLPPLAEQRRIVAKLQELEPLLERYGKSDEALDKLNATIKEQLKKSILQEAIQGRLVPQIEGEGTATELLQQIKQEKQRLVKEGKLKKSALTDSVIYKGDDNRYWERIGKETRCIDEEIPFEVPKGWEWCRMENVANLYTGNSINEKEKNVKYSGVIGKEYIGTKDVGFDNVIKYDNGISIPQKYITQFRTAPAQSILLCIEGGSAGRKIAQTNRDVCFGNKLCCFDFYTLAISRYTYYYLQSSSFFENFKGNVSGIIGGVSVNRLKTLLLPLPPLPEQRRIVAQIEKLFKQLQ